MKITFLLWSLLLPLTLGARPGDLLPDQFPDLTAQALVTSAVTTEEGTTFLSGFFTEIDGITRPGLAKLTPSGHLDPSFAPPTFSVADFDPDPNIFIFGVDLERISHRTLFPLQNGGIIISGSPLQLEQQAWELRNPDGTLNTALLPEFPRKSATPPRPQFKQNGRLFIMRRNSKFAVFGGPRIADLTAYQSDTLLPDPTFKLAPDLPAPPFQASPAADGKIWVLGRAFTEPPSQSDFWLGDSPPAHTLYRLLPTGELDLTFAPEILGNSNNHALLPNPGPGLQIVSNWPGRRFFSPSPSFESLAFQTRDAQGAIIKTTNASFNIGFSDFFHLLPDGRVLAQSLNFGDLIIRDLATNETTFTLPLNTPEAPPSTRTVTQFPDGKFLVGGNRRFLADGSPDPAWHTARLSRPAAISQLLPQKDGIILALGNFDFAAGLPRAGAIKLNPDTSLAPAFNPSVDLRSTRKILQKQNGNLIAFLSRAFVDADQNRFHLLELSPSGSLISPIREPNTTSSFSSEGPNPIDQSRIANVSLQSDDSLLVTTVSGGEISNIRLLRYPALPDSSPTTIFENRNGISLFIFPDDRLLINRQLHTQEGQLITTAPTFPPNASPVTLLPDSSLLLITSSQFPKITLQKWHPDTGLDPTFGNQTIPNIGTFPNFITPSTNGKLFIRATTSPFFGSPSQLLRLHPNGQLDPTFRISNLPDSAFTTPAILPLDSPDGPVLWLGGAFTDINGQQKSSLALLDNSSTTDFPSWMQATASRLPHTLADLHPEADPDHDGATNYFEYAAATDPFRASPTHAIPLQTAPLTYQFPCNPEAPEVLRQLQTSTDLLTWSPARADQIRLQTSADCFTWQLLPNNPKTFTRLQILGP